MIKIAILFAGLSGLLGLLTNKKVGMFFLSESKSKTVGNKKNETNSGGLTATGITIMKKWEMPKELTEISGLSNIDDKRFACVQDELGTIFIYNIGSSSVEKEIPFGVVGDYEGLAVVGETVWVLRADGKLFEVNNINVAKPSVKEYSTHLTIKQDSEGLCYDKKNNRLLIAIKGAELETQDYKGIYAFDLSSKKMNQQPVFKIDLLNEIFGTNGLGKKKKGSMNPSGISIHPLNGDMYIIDGRDPKLLIMDAAGTIKKLYQLNNNEFAQPEGITFNAAGDLFISNEGTKQPGNILQVKIDP
ncbi:MAG TPA: SdiA-regulated domain-containing protein [Chitinophagaceae bacterium]|nr:SdiA-regulated domain-containing protein [Chitinophagaceae bacterium]